MCLPSIRKCFCDLDELNPEIWNHFIKWSFLSASLIRMNFLLAQNLTLCNIDMPYHTIHFGQIIQILVKMDLFSIHLMGAVSEVKSRTIFKIIYVK